MTDYTLSESEREAFVRPKMDDAGCRRLGAIFSGAALGAQIRNEEYLLSRCAPEFAGDHAETLRALRRAAYLRTDAALAAVRDHLGRESSA